MSVTLSTVRHCPIKFTAELFYQLSDQNLYWNCQEDHQIHESHPTAPEEGLLIQVVVEVKAELSDNGGNL